ncbi:MAG TPA: DUF1800 domain-containing protein [Planctomycetaceae bacterium]|nr:DUF1800 domain-containing protein [Planctomycetaceae bacterium]
MSWEPYTPTSDQPWDSRRTVHLHRRTVFGACWAEIERDLEGDPQDAITRVLQGKNRLGGLRPNFESKSRLICNTALDTGSVDRLAAWWIFRCLHSPFPLEERLTLMWHNHFATGADKVGNLRLMYRQNEVFRKHSQSQFGALLTNMNEDPALLVWLDAPLNKAGRPNENLAREIMELFALGIGHYTEQDIQEAARALTGSTVKQLKYHFNQSAHDKGEKEILGERGHWTPQDLPQILLQREAASKRIAWRLVSEFFGEGVVSSELRDELAAGLRSNGLSIAWGVETILRSMLFFSDANIQSRVCDPVSFVISTIRSLELWENAPSTLAMAVWIKRMGQQLFQPPNVGGWSGGRAWLSTKSVITRSNFASVISEHVNAQTTAPTDQINSLRLLLGGGEVSTNARDANSEEINWLHELLANPNAFLH